MSGEYTQFTISGLPRWISNLELKLWMRSKISNVIANAPTSSANGAKSSDNANIHVSVNHSAEDFWWDEMNGIPTKSYTANIIILDNDLSKLFLDRMGQMKDEDYMFYPLELGGNGDSYRVKLDRAQNFSPNSNSEEVPILSPTEVLKLRRKRLTLDGMLTIFNSTEASNIRLGSFTSVSFGSFAQEIFHSAGQ